jgi:hypothetical protein
MLLQVCTCNVVLELSAIRNMFMMLEVTTEGFHSPFPSPYTLSSASIP